MLCSPRRLPRPPPPRYEGPLLATKSTPPHAWPSIADGAAFGWAPSSPSEGVEVAARDGTLPWGVVRGWEAPPPERAERWETGGARFLAERVRELLELELSVPSMAELGSTPVLQF